MQITVETMAITESGWPTLLTLEFVDPPTLREVLTQLKREYPAAQILFSGEGLSGWFVVFRNGREIIGPGTLLQAGDQLLVTVPPSGG